MTDAVSQVLFCKVLLYAAGVGAFLGIVYDIFRIVRIATTPTGEASAKGKMIRVGTWLSDFLIFGEDILFSLIASVTVTVFLFNINDGKVRWFALVGAGIGFFLYYFTIGKIVFACAQTILRMIRFILHLLWRVTGYPVMKLIRFLIRHIGCGCAFVIGAVASAHLRRRALRLAERGFAPYTVSLPRYLSGQNRQHTDHRSDV